MLRLEFEIWPPEISERVVPGETPERRVERLAREKAEAVRDRFPRALLVSGDTLVVLDGEILEKPADPDEARSMLLRMSGREHTVLTALAVASPQGGMPTGVTRARVEFRAFDGEAAAAYVATGEPLDKAGSYGIQGAGAALVAGIRGDYDTVLGFPVSLFLELLEATGWRYFFGRLVPLDV